MSKKEITPVPGLHRVQEREVNTAKLPLAVKVTGRHVAAIGYLVSLAAERSRSRASISTVFKDNGALEVVYIYTPTRQLEVRPGQYVFLNHDEDRVRISDAEFYDGFYKPVSL